MASTASLDDCRNRCPTTTGALSADRADFLSKLFSRPRPAGLGPASTAVDLFTAFAKSAPSEALYAQNFQAIKDTLTKHHGTPLVRADVDGIEFVYNSFFLAGPTLRYGPAGRIEALSLRLYNPEARQWSLNFSNITGGTMAIPTVGEFKEGRGEFYAQEILDGRSILVRFVISEFNRESAHFEQAFSDDGGKTWEVNWEQRLERVK